MMIKCKDCKWWDDVGETAIMPNDMSWGLCHFYPSGQPKRDTNYCSKAEPKDSEQED